MTYCGRGIELQQTAFSRFFFSLFYQCSNNYKRSTINIVSYLLKLQILNLNTSILEVILNLNTLFLNINQSLLDQIFFCVLSFQKFATQVNFAFAVGFNQKSNLHFLFRLTIIENDKIVSEGKSLLNELTQHFLFTFNLLFC